MFIINDKSVTGVKTILNMAMNDNNFMYINVKKITINVILKYKCVNLNFLCSFFFKENLLRLEFWKTCFFLECNRLQNVVGKYSTDGAVTLAVT